MLAPDWLADLGDARQIILRGGEVGLPGARRARLAGRLVVAAVAGAAIDTLAPLRGDGSREAGQALGALLELDAASECDGAALYEPPSHLAVKRGQYAEVLRRDPCSYCGLRPWRRRHTLDHIEPRAHGGGNAISDVVGACPACNVEKGDRSLLVFLLDRRSAA